MSKQLLLTGHATKRMQQRAIDALLVNVLLEFGVEEHDGRGGVRRYLDKRTQRLLEKAMKAFLVEANGRIVTVGWRTK